MNLLEAMGLPTQFGITLLLFSLILAIAPYVSGKDFGILKIPEFEGASRRWLRLFGPCFLILAILIHLPMMQQKAGGEDALDQGIINVEKEYTKAEVAVDNISRDISILRGTYEADDDYSWASSKVAETAPKLADQILLISEKQLDLGHLISQQHFAAYAYTMAADASAESSRRISLANNARSAVEKSMGLVERAESRSGSGAEYSQKLVAWINEERVREQNLYILAIALAVLSHEKGGLHNDTVLELITEIRQMSPAYLEDYPPDENKALQWVLLSQSAESAG